ncbi:MAG TPA: DUF3187 family protein [Gemmatimonadales bacterium]|nr:DUF3187 family protein [Gemmatimonadales bacterium]
MWRGKTRLAFLLVGAVLLTPAVGAGQGLPQFAPMNPMGASRTGVYFQPFLDPAPGRWVADFAVDYASVIEYNRLPPADYVLDSELLRVTFGLRRDLGRRSFLLLGAGLGGAYAGFLDGFLDWYHGTLGIEVSERESRPRDRFLYTVTLPDGAGVSRFRSDLFLEDTRVGLGFRLSPGLQSVLSLTLPTSTGPEGFGRGVASIALMSTLRSPLNPRLLYEGSLGFGYTPSHGSLPEGQREQFLALTSGLRWKIWGRQALYANIFYHSPYYRNTTLPALDRRDLSLDFGWILADRGGQEWRVGLTEDLEPGGPGVDLVVRLGRTF